VGVSRREFLYAGGAAGAGAALFVFLPSVFKSDGTVVPGAVVGLYPQIEVARLSELQEGVPVFFDYPQVGQANILVKMGEPVNHGVGPDGDIVAFSRICTHMGCPIGEYKHDHKILGPCPCHFTTFDLIHGGMVTLGQATQNLPQVLLNVEGDSVNAGGLMRLLYGYNNSLEGGELVGAST
jgi:arsenite oxidase small subunit